MAWIQVKIQRRSEVRGGKKLMKNTNSIELIGLMSLQQIMKQEDYT